MGLGGGSTHHLEVERKQGLGLGTAVVPVLLTFDGARLRNRWLVGGGRSRWTAKELQFNYNRVISFHRVNPNRTLG
jgi:hypothetical protein